MIRFLSFITEEVSNNTKGVLHELLVAHHLNGGKHVDKHPDVHGNTPKEAHDALKSTLSPSEYHQINDRAKAAAADIKKAVSSHGPIHSVQWTSKPGDLHRATGIHASQKEDASDIVVTTKNHKGELKHHGISLKVTDAKKGNVPVSNPGSAALHGGITHLHDHQRQLKKDYPALAKMTNKTERKAYMNDNPKIAADIKSRNKGVLTKIAGHLQSRLSKMAPEDVAHHIAHHVLHAHQTPMEKAGHSHIKHTTFGTSNYTFKHENHYKDFHHILSDPKNITVEHKGTSVVFKHKGKAFASHRIKFSSQSDPLSSIKGSGQLL